MEILEYEKLLEQLQRLTEEETLGREYYVLYNQNMDYAQYIYLINNPNQKSIKDLMQPKSVLIQNQIRKEYKKYHMGGLTEKDFFPPDENIIVERLLHYIYIDPHKHEFCECSFVFTGSCIHNVNGFNFEQRTGNFIYIPPNVTHTLYPVDNSVCLTIKVRTNTFRRMTIPDLLSFTCPISFECNKDDFISRIILCMYYQQQNKNLYFRELCFHLFQTLLLYILQNHRNNSTILMPRAKKSNQIVDILSYIANHYQTVTVKEISAFFHYNESYFSRMFREQTGQTFSNILKQYKLERAADLLQRTSLPLNQICDSVGYKDVSQFIHSFRQTYHMTPGQYRQQQTSPND